MLEKQSYESITVTQIATMAGVSRMAFYRNYETKDDVIKGFLASSFAGFSHGLQEEMGISKREAITRYFQFIYGIRAEIQALIDNQKENLLYEQISLHLRDAIGTLVETRDSDRIRYFIAAMRGIFYSITIEWVSDGCRQRPEEMARIFLEISRVKDGLPGIFEEGIN